MRCPYLVVAALSRQLVENDKILDSYKTVTSEIREMVEGAQ